MIQELFSWLDAQRITYIPVDTEVVDIPGFGRLFTADLSGVESIFRGDGHISRYTSKEVHYARSTNY